MQTIIDWITQHQGQATAVGAVIVDVAFRLYPSEKIRSLLVYSAKLLFLISDLLSKIVPDRRPNA